MSIMATVASQPFIEEGEEERASRNFNTIQLEQKGCLRWHIISAVGDQEIAVDIRQIDPSKSYPVRFSNITNGAVTPFVSYRNLYVSNPQNATGYFILRVEACDD